MARTRMHRRRIAPAEDEPAVVRFWRDSHRTERTILQYLHWVRRFSSYCRGLGVAESTRLTRKGVEEFARQYRGPRMRRPAPRRVLGPVRSALLAWSYALRKLGRRVPEWQPPPPVVTRPPLIAEYVAYRKLHRGVTDGTLKRDIQTAEGFLATLRSRGRSVTRARVTDIDEFVTQLTLRVCSRTLADACSSLRAFLRFLYATSKLNRDLAALVAAPRVRRVDHPPRALSWSDVRRLLRAAQGAGPGDRRAYSILLLMATNGLGAAEVAALQLVDIDWVAGVLRVRRPKTKVSIALPLLPAVAKAIATYLCKERPKHATTRALFLTSQMPHRAMSTAAIRFLVRQQARRAGIDVPVGGHTLRHSHATRQIDTGANMKIVGDILGHRRPATTSVYVRVAMRRLRGVGLPVPA